MSKDVLGKPHDRLEGRLKVTGALRYSGDRRIENMAYGYLVTSTIARGEIRSMDVSEPRDPLASWQCTLRFIH